MLAIRILRDSAGPHIHGKANAGMLLIIGCQCRSGAYVGAFAERPIARHAECRMGSDYQ